MFVEMKMYIAIPLDENKQTNIMVEGTGQIWGGECVTEEHSFSFIEKEKKGI